MVSAKHLQRKTRQKRNQQIKKQLRFIKKHMKEAMSFGKDYCFTYDDLYDETIEILENKGLFVTDFSADEKANGFFICWRPQTNANK